MFETVLFWGVVGVTVFHLLQSVWLIARLDKKVNQWRTRSARSISEKLALTTSCSDSSSAKSTRTSTKFFFPRVRARTQTD